MSIYYVSAIQAMLGTMGTVFAVVTIAIGLFTIHEFGHYVFALIVGVPTEKMQFHLLRSMPPRVEFLGVSGFSEVDRYLSLSNRQLTAAMFIIASGGHIAELLSAVVFTTVGLLVGHEWFATQFVLLSTFITVSYLIVAVMSVVLCDAPFGDPIELWRQSVPATMLMYVGFFSVMSSLIWLLTIPRETLIKFGLIVPLLFIPMALMTATNQ